MENIREGITFDDVLLEPGYSATLPKDVRLTTRLSRRITLNVPLISSPMDTVTESRMAIAMALQGGIGIIHKNLPIEAQANEISIVKRYENGFVFDPMALHPGATIKDVYAIRKEYGYKNVPIVEKDGTLLGLVSDLDYFFPDDANEKVEDVMKPVEELVVERDGIQLKKANEVIREHRLRVLLIVDKQGKLVSMVTRSDLMKNEAYPLASKDEYKRLLVGAAVSVGDPAIERAGECVEAGADVIIVDTAHGHSKGVIETTARLRKDKFFKHVDIIAGNIATKEGAKALISAGADAVKVGIGPGSICTTRVIAGVGVPQITAVAEAVKAARVAKIPVIADGGIKYSGDIVKALAAGAESAMIGSLFAGTDESPGETEYFEGRVYKAYRGMGSVSAMTRGSNDRYAQADVIDERKFVPEGIEGRVLYKGKLSDYLFMLLGGVRSGFGYVGARTIAELHEKARFVKITHAGLLESHPHDVTITKQAPNYQR